MRKHCKGLLIFLPLLCSSLFYCFYFNYSCLSLPFVELSALFSNCSFLMASLTWFDCCRWQIKYKNRLRQVLSSLTGLWLRSIGLFSTDKSDNKLAKQLSNDSNTNTITLLTLTLILRLTQITPQILLRLNQHRANQPTITGFFLHSALDFHKHLFQNSISICVCSSSVYWKLFSLIVYLCLSCNKNKHIL